MSVSMNVRVGMGVFLISLCIGSLFNRLVEAAEQKTTVEIQVEGVLERAWIETVSPSGFLLGSAQYGGLGAVAGGILFSRGCQVLVRVEGKQVVVRKPDEVCRTAQEGRPLSLTKKVWVGKTGRVLGIDWQ